MEIILDQRDDSTESREPMGIWLGQRTETCAIFYKSQYFVNCLTPQHEQRDAESSGILIGYIVMTECSDWLWATWVLYVRDIVMFHVRI